MASPKTAEILPLAPFQEGLLFHAMYDDEGPDVYAVQVVADLAGELDPATLRAACQTLLTRHPNLRACFRHSSSGKAVQVVPGSVELPWTEHDLSSLSESERAAERERLIEQDRVRRFDLARPPLLRCMVIALGDDRYTFVLTNHHILLDGWSMSILLRELFATYAKIDLPDVTPYRDYLSWLSKRDQHGAETAWRTALAGIEAPTRIAPGSDPTPRIPEAVETELDEELTGAILAWARSRGLTMSTVVQGAWAVLLGLLTGEDDVLFGATVAGRPPEIAGIDSMVGLFINTVPVRVRLDPAMSLERLLTGLQEWNSALLPHQYLGLADIQRIAAVGPLFDTVLVFENYPLDAGILPVSPAGLQVTDVDGRDASHYPINIRIVQNSRMRFRIEYRPDLLDRSRVEEIAARLTYLMGQIVVGSGGLVGGVWAGEGGSVFAGSGGGVVGGVVERVCGVEAGRPAVGGVSYGGLVVVAGGVSVRLAGCGVGEGCLVGVLAGPGPLFIGGVLGVLWSGAGYVPLDVDAPVARSAAMVTDAGIWCLLVAPEYVGLAGEIISGVEGGRLVVMDDPTATQTPAPGPVRGGHDDPAYVIFTSGSTGRPKGAMVHRRGMLNHLLAKIEDLGLTADDCVIANAPLTFDVSVWQMLAALLVGGRVRTVDRDVAADPDTLFQIVDTDHATILEVVPSVLRTALDTWDTTGHPPDCSTLRWLVVTGETLPPELCDRWFTYFPDTPMVNAYGPTECSDDVTHAIIKKGDLHKERTPIGHPVRNTRLYILGTGLAPVPPGIAGELYVAGTGVGHGYIHDQTRTATTFPADPFGPPGTRMYRTGDRVISRPDGQLEFLGRRDHQVKIRGHRIELGEIETALRTIPHITDAAATLRTDHTGQPRIIGYLQTTPGHQPPPTPETARTTLTTILPDYMIPATFVIMDTLPLTTHGKVDRAALPTPDLTTQTSNNRPRTPEEEILCGMFADVLGLPHIGPDDDFFELGGHSLLATRLISRLRHQLHIELPIRALFDAPTPATLTHTLRTTGQTHRPPLTPGPRPHPLPLSYAQQRLWFLNRLDPDTATYNLANAVHLTGDLDIPALQHALNDVTERHETLRTIYPETDGTPHQVILTTHTTPLNHITPDQITTTAQHGFDLTTQTPLRAYLATTGTNEHILLLVLHHIAADGWSVAPLINDLTTAYQTRHHNQPPNWKPLPAQYADYMAWQHHLLGTENNPDSLINHQLTYWRTTLADLPEALHLPTDHPRPPRTTYQGDTHTTQLDEKLTTTITNLARTTGTTTFMIIQAALATLLTKLGAGHDIPIGTPIAGRTDENLNDLIGFFVNTLVLRTNTSGNPTFTELIKRVRDTDLAAYTHQDLPFERLVDELNPTRTLSHQPLIQIMLAFQNNTQTTTQPLNLHTTPHPLTTHTAKFDLAFEFTENPTNPPTITTTIEYSTDLYTPTTIATLTTRLKQLLHTLTTNPNTPINTITTLTPTEHHQILHQWNTTDRPIPDVTLTDLFHAQVARTPDNVALISAGHPMSYAELDAAASELAAEMTARGAAPERIVALALPRGPELITAIIAVLKTGAAFLPIDPGFPADRITGMLTDASPVITLTPEGMQSAAAPSRSPIRLQADHPAYVIYTSGSTGRPKGVVIPHRAVVNFLTAMATEVPLSPSDQWLAVTTIGFDISIFELFAPLTSGAAVHLATRDEILDTATLARLLGEATVMQATPTLWTELLSHTDGELAGVRVLAGGEALPPALATGLADRGAQVMNLYGPTETTIWSTSAPITTATAAHPMIGSPIANTHVFVLDAGLNPVPAGVVGELYIAGAGLARGYLNRPGLTAERFIACPHAQPGQRMYRTGDLARWTPTGQLDYLGRTDHQIKLRGFRIEPAEIETTLTHHPQITQATVILREDRPGDHRLIAYITPTDPNNPPDPTQLRTHTTQTLPDYMTPAAYVIMNTLPLTPNGKINRQALPPPQYTTTQPRKPRTPHEQTLTNLFTQTLGIPTIGIDDNFFELGGNSLLVSKLTSRIETSLNVQIGIRALFEAPTVAMLAARLNNSGPDSPLELLTALRTGQGRHPLFCMHPSGGISWMYIGLAPYLDPAYPIYGFQARGIGGPDKLPESIEAMAEDYIGRLRELQPHGPYHLIGWSFGGLLAHEVAVQLQAVDEQIALLAILDAYPSTTADTAFDEQHVLREFLGYLGHEQLPDRTLELSDLVAALQSFDNPLSHFEEQEIANLFHIWRNNISLSDHFTPGRYTGRAIHFRAMREQTDDSPTVERWTPYIDGAIETHDVDCTHDRMMEQEPLSHIGRVLTAELNAIDG